MSDSSYGSFSIPRSIAAGLPQRFFRQARSMGLFPDWRLSILNTMGRKPPLADWRTRESNDLGMMLVEMGAYLADVISFYDALISGESYLSTATLEGAARRLVSLVGYRPRPAVAARALLAAQADGIRLVSLPAGSAFRSGAFLDDSLNPQPPQTFELTRPAILEPRINRLTVTPVKSGTLPTSFDRLLVKSSGCRLKAGDPLLLSFGEHLDCSRVLSIIPCRSRMQGVPLLELRLTDRITPPAGSGYIDLRILAPGSAARLWQGREGGEPKGSVGGRTLCLDSPVPLRPGEPLLFLMGEKLEAHRARAVSTTSRVLLYSRESLVKDSDDKVERTLVSPDISIPLTSVTLESALSWSGPDVSRITLYHSLSDAATVVAPPAEALFQGDGLSFPTLTGEPRIPSSRMLLLDGQGRGQEVNGSLDVANRRAVLDRNPAWDDSLTIPVQLMGNVLDVSRGETVRGELLGVGDPSLPTQTFKLARKPLTYLARSGGSGLSSTLCLRVGGVLWSEVPSFYGCSRSERVYLVRHDDEGETYVTIGGAARVPSASRIIADYRFGAGLATPPAGSITQLARPVAGLRQVTNPLAPFGGADAESATEIAANAPRSALVMGRAVSIPDLEAATAAVAGVRGASASWRWDGAGLRPAVLILYIGDNQLLPLVRARLRELSEPDAAITVERALPQTARLQLQLLVDPCCETEEVEARVMQALYAAASTPGGGGMLRPERLGPGGAVCLSRLMQRVMEVEGVEDVCSASFNGTPFTESVRRPSPGCYWNFGEPGRSGFGIVVSGVNR